jgi:DNA processing protein
MSLSELIADPRVVRAALSRVSLPGDARMAQLVREEGADRALALRCSGDLEQVLIQARADLDAVHASGARLVCPGDAEWPTGLDELDWAGDGRAAPLALWVRGEIGLDRLCRRAIAVVGARSATFAGRATAREIAGGVAEQGWTVVSGAAEGIDAAAHEAALAAGGSTVAVMAGGLDVVYPRRHAPLLRQIAQQGAVLTEAPPGTPPQRLRFLTRNRLIAALGHGTVMVEAALRSGALSTVAHAHALGRQVCCVPGPVGSQVSAGCHRQIREGMATLVTNAAEVLADVGPLGTTAQEELPRPRGPRDGLAPTQLSLLDALPTRGGLSITGLMAVTGTTVRQVTADLGNLELAGLISHSQGLVTLTSRGRRPSGAPEAAPGGA